MPDPAAWAYTFDHLAEIVEGLLNEVGFTGPMGIFMQDYGGPIGNRLIAGHPEWLQWQVNQNANTYEEGFSEAWDGIRHALWVDRSAANEAVLEAFLQPDTVKVIYTTAYPDPSKISPDNCNTDLYFLSRPHAHRVQLDLFSTIGRMPRSTARGRRRCVRGSRSHSSSGVRETSSSPPPVARPTCMTCRTPEMVRLDSGHFAVEDNLDLIADTIVSFYDSRVGLAVPVAAR